MINNFKSVEQVYFPNLHQVISNLNSIIKNDYLSKRCKQSLIKLTNGIIRKEHWALACQYHFYRMRLVFYHILKFTKKSISLSILCPITVYDSSSQGKSGKLSGNRYVSLLILLSNFIPK